MEGGERVELERRGEVKRQKDKAIEKWVKKYGRKN